MNGLGTRIDSSKIGNSGYIGEWKEGEQDGFGKESYASADTIIDGRWSKGKWNG
ncbi:hypothetical protein FACS1894152_0030 [Bacilli bacterium]|nr:hypothetical protein FACS1894152_0030 [Bacilli bacterium]